MGLNSAINIANERSQGLRLMKNCIKLLIAILLLSSCSSQAERIQILEKELNIKLGDNYNVIQDDNISEDDFGGDYTLILKIKLDTKEVDRIVTKIQSEPYFNELGKFKNEDGGTRYNGPEEEQLFSIANDSIKSSKYRGSWYITEMGYRFLDLGTDTELIDAEINLEENTLTFELIHL